MRGVGGSQWTPSVFGVLGPRPQDVSVFGAAAPGGCQATVASGVFGSRQCWQRHLRGRTWDVGGCELGLGREVRLWAYLIFFSHARVGRCVLTNRGVRLILGAREAVPNHH